MKLGKKGIVILKAFFMLIKNMLSVFNFGLIFDSKNEPKPETYCILKNKNWNFSKMLFIKNEEKLKNIAPHVAVNL